MGKKESERDQNIARTKEEFAQARQANYTQLVDNKFYASKSQLLLSRFWLALPDAVLQA